MKLRPSSMDRVLACPESENAGQNAVRISTSTKGADLGSAFHRWARAIDKPESEWLSLDSLAKEHAIERRDLERLVSYALLRWRRGDATCPPLGDLFPSTVGETHVERRLAIDTPHELPGTADRMWYGTVEDVRVLRILDWKTGREDSDHRAQMRSYGVLGLTAYPDAERVEVYIVRLALWSLDVEHFAPAYLRDWWGTEVPTRIRNGITKPPTFSPGPHCTFCPRFHECPGRLAAAKSALALAEVADMPALTEENKHELGPVLVSSYRRLKMAVAAAERYFAFVREEAMNVGPIPDGEGRALRIVTTNPTDLDAQKAWPILMEHVGAEALAAACDISLSKCSDALRDRTPTGQKKAAVEAMRTALEEAGAVSTKPVYQLREGKP